MRSLCYSVRKVVLEKEMRMRFEESDRDWSDWHKGLSLERQKRYEEVMAGIIDGLEEIFKAHNEGYTINAIVPHGLFAVGVAGDKRIYAPIVMLTYGSPPPTMDHVSRMSNYIINRLPVSRVIYNLMERVICDPKAGKQILVPAENQAPRW